MRAKALTKPGLLIFRHMLCVLGGKSIHLCILFFKWISSAPVLKMQIYKGQDEGLNKEVLSQIQGGQSVTKMNVWFIDNSKVYPFTQVTYR